MRAVRSGELAERDEGRRLAVELADSALVPAHVVPPPQLVAGVAPHAAQLESARPVDRLARGVRERGPAEEIDHTHPQQDLRELQADRGADTFGPRVLPDVH